MIVLEIIFKKIKIKIMSDIKTKKIHVYIYNNKVSHKYNVIDNNVVIDMIMFEFSKVDFVNLKNRFFLKFVNI